MAKNSDLSGAMQTNASQYQGATGQPGMVQSTQNAADATRSEYLACNALGTGWATMLDGAQAKANPKGVGSLPTGATGLKTKAPGKIIK